MSEENLMTARSETVVRKFIHAWDSRDLEGALALLSDDIIYINQPLEPIVGLPGMRRIIKALMEQCVAVEFKLLNLFGNGSRVCTERLDCWDFDGSGVTLRLPCVGMFDVNKEGKIKGWRDYFDNQYWTSHGGPTLEPAEYAAD
jgi:limonene-1,2-epoxide hydrolase